MLHKKMLHKKIVHKKMYKTPVQILGIFFFNFKFFTLQNLSTSMA